MENKPSKLLLALALCFSVSVAHAGNDNNSKYNHNNDSKKDSSGKSSNVKATEGCTTSLVASSCGTVQKTVCTSAGGESVLTKAKNDKDSKRQSENSKDRGDGKDHTERDHGSNTKHSGRDQSKDDRDEGFGKPYGYHWEQDNGGGKKQRKVTICHREGGGFNTLDVDDDGKYQGHHNHAGDTEGNCEHQDERTGKHKDSKNSGRDVVRIYKDETCGAPLVYAHKEPDGKHHQERDHEGDKKDGNSKYSRRDTSKDDKDHAGNTIDLNKHRKGYRWEHIETVTTTTGSGNNKKTTTTDYKQRKVTICHRMGGARVTIDVDDDGFFHGHSKHPMDTEGRCEDQDDKRGKHTDSDNNGKDVVRIAAPDCNIPPGAPIVTPKSCSLPSDCNAVGVTCTLLGTGTRPSRGGVRNMR